MKHIAVLLLLLISTFSWAQDDAEKKKQQAEKKATTLVYEGNELISEDDYIMAEVEYRKAIYEAPNPTVGAYNLGTSYYEKGSFDEALYRLEQAAKVATTKDEKHKAYHNIGNILYKNKRCKEAAEAYKNALRNDPSDDETRYNYVLAKECAEQQQDQNDQNQDQNEDNKDQNQDQDQNQDNQDQNKDQNDENQDENQDNKDDGDQDEKEGDDKQDENGEPKDDEKDNKDNEQKDKGGDGEDKKDQKPPQQQPGQLSPQQVKNLLEAMNNQEQKVQEKMNAEKQQGVRVQTDKDW